MLCCLPPRTNSGLLHFVHLEVIKQHTFLDFIQAGTQLDFTVAVDLTASNGDPRLPTSLHYVGGNTPSQYEIAIRSGTQFGLR
ncbi:hypothetical protein OESDEN_15218 [Oesophagostomum dentatum]|uniref:Copine C-terminal domain-containing protein n=1 Tax=Oesophagostomum dentatum TaxID=61180 RepID=A0A0B1SPE2_OESDE|nr:hypothetical protein OESDEN_15218 [Oesophagostomum dentatum]